MWFRLISPVIFPPPPSNTQKGPETSLTGSKSPFKVWRDRDLRGSDKFCFGGEDGNIHNWISFKFPISLRIASHACLDFLPQTRKGSVSLSTHRTVLGGREPKLVSVYHGKEPKVLSFKLYWIWYHSSVYVLLKKALKFHCRTTTTKKANCPLIP